MSEDERWMSSALSLAAMGEGYVEPNPMVGCVIVKDGVCIGEGYHQRFGGPHAEIEAIRSVVSATDLVGATVYVTLEPCCHFGKTPPCADALIQAKVGRVVAAMRDPFPKVDGGGLNRLQDHGIDVCVGVLGSRAEQLNAPYLKRVRLGLPWVIAKWAMTIDGRIATRTGESQWITGAMSRQQVHQLRGRVDAIAVGVGTALTDDPLLTARPSGPRVAERVVFCQTRLPRIDSRLLTSLDDAPVLLVAGPRIDDGELKPYLDRGVRVFRSGESQNSESIRRALVHLGTERGVTNLMLEGGSRLVGEFSDLDQIDEYHVYVGAKLFGGLDAFAPVGGAGVGPIAEAREVKLCEVDRYEDDVRLIFRRSDPRSR